MTREVNRVFVLRPSRALVLVASAASVAIAPARARPQSPAPAHVNETPRIVFVESPAAVVQFDGQPAWVPVEKASLERATNTRVLVLRDAAAGVVLVHVLDGWVGAPSLAGPWAVATKVPSAVNEIAREAARRDWPTSWPGPRIP